MAYEALAHPTSRSRTTTFFSRNSPKALARVPFADAVGYSFALRGSGGTVLLDRQTDLGLSPGNLTHIGSVL
jgi:hypothetical protein